MKKRKEGRLILSICAIMFMSLFFGIVSISPSAASTASRYKMTFKRYHYPYYRLIDINGDGTEELFLSKRPEGWNSENIRNKVLMFTIYKRKVVLLKSWKFKGVKDELRYSKKWHTVTYFPGLGSEDPTIIYKIKKGKLRIFHYYSSHRGSTPSKDKNYVDGKRRSNKTLMKLYRRYYWNSKDLSFNTCPY